MTRESAAWNSPWLKRLALVTMWPCRFHLLESSGRDGQFRSEAIRWKTTHEFKQLLLQHLAIRSYYFSF